MALLPESVTTSTTGHVANSNQVHKKLNALVRDVKADYGAAGDGTTDDTTAVQNAINAGGVTLFPPGTYLCGQLTLARGTHLKGANSGNYVYDYVNNNGTFLTPFTTSEVSTLKRKNATDAHFIVGPEAARRVLIEDLHIDGNAANQTVASNIIQISDTASPAAGASDTHWIVQRCYIHGWTQSASKGPSGSYGIYLGQNRQACRFNDCLINYNNGHGVEVKGSDAKFLNCILGDNSWDGIVISAYVTKITGCDFYNQGQGGIVVGTNVRRTMLIGNGLDRNAQYGIKVNSGASGVSISANQFSMNGTLTQNTYPHIDVQTTTGMVNIIGNTFSEHDAGTSYNEANYSIQLATSATAFEAGNNHIDTGGGDRFARAAVGGYCNDSSRLYVTARPAFRESQQLWMSDATAAVAAQGLDLASALTEFDATWQGTRRTLTPLEGGREAQIAVRARKITSTAASSVVISIRDTSNTANILASVTISSTNTANTNWEAVGTWTSVGTWFSTASPSKTLAIYTSGGNGADDWVFRDVTLKWRG